MKLPVKWIYGKLPKWPLILFLGALVLLGCSSGESGSEDALDHDILSDGDENSGNDRRLSESATCFEQCTPEVTLGNEYCGEDRLLYTSKCQMDCAQIDEADSFFECKDNEQVVSCRFPKDCVLVDIDCCGCKTGGESIAVNHNYASRFALPPDKCKGTLCLGLFNCSPLECVDGECVGGSNKTK